MREIVRTALEIVGLSLIIGGIAMVFVPAAVVAAGVAFILISRGVEQ